MIEARKPAAWPQRWSGAAFYLAVAGVIGLALAGPGYRAGFMPLIAGLLCVAAALLVFVLAFVCGVIGLIWRRRRGDPMRVRTIATVIVAGAVTVNAAVWLSRAFGTPPIHDISTDLEDPPQFHAVLALRRAAGAVNSPDYVRKAETPTGVIDVPEAQRRAYPDIVPLMVELPADKTFDLAERAAVAMPWTIDAMVPAAGRIEATATTTYFGFEDDVVIRVRPAGTASVVDVRSESRIGVGDVGTNAARVRNYLDRVMSLARKTAHPAATVQSSSLSTVIGRSRTRTPVA